MSKVRGGVDQDCTQITDPAYCQVHCMYSSWNTWDFKAHFDKDNLIFASYDLVPCVWSRGNLLTTYLVEESTSEITAITWPISRIEIEKFIPLSIHLFSHVLKRIIHPVRIWITIITSMTAVEHVSPRLSKIGDYLFTVYLDITRRFPN